jgi:hypothetical protein
MMVAPASLNALAALDVVVMVMAVDQVFDRLVRHLLDLGNVVRAAGRLAVTDRIGGDHAVVGDDEHRLMVAVAEDVDVVRTSTFVVSIGGRCACAVVANAATISAAAIPAR